MSFLYNLCFTYAKLFITLCHAVLHWPVSSGGVAKCRLAGTRSSYLAQWSVHLGGGGAAPSRTHSGPGGHGSTGVGRGLTFPEQ